MVESWLLSAPKKKKKKKQKEMKERKSNLQKFPLTLNDNFLFQQIGLEEKLSLDIKNKLNYKFIIRENESTENECKDIFLINKFYKTKFKSILNITLFLSYFLIKIVSIVTLKIFWSVFTPTIIWLYW